MTQCPLAQEYARTSGEKIAHKRLFLFFFFKQKSKFPQKAYFIYTNINVCWFFEHLSNWLTELLVWLSRDIFWIFMMPSLATKFEVSDV